MRGVQLAKHFAQHLLEVEIVVDVRQELLIGLAVTFPVNTMNLRVVELVFHLSPYVVEEILALLGWLIVEVSLKADVLGAESAQIHLLDAASVADEKVLHILVGLQVALAYALHHELGRAVLQVVLPEVVIILEGCLVVELVAVFREHSIAHVRRICGEAYDSVAAVFDVQLQWLHFFHLYLSGLLLLFVSLLFSLFLLLVFLLLLFVLVGVSQFYLFLAHVEAVVGVQVEEHDVGIVFCSPASMTAVAGSVALEEHCLAVEHPFAVAVAVAGIGQVVNLFAVSLYQRNILVVPAAVADIGRKKPFAVWRPFETDVSIAVRVDVFAIEHGADFLRFQIDDAECSAVFEESYFLAVRRVLRILRCNACFHQLLFLDIGSIGEVLLFLILDLRLVNLPYAIALGCIDQGSAVWRETQVALLLRCVGNALGSGVFYRSYVYVAMHHESHFLGVWRNGNLCSSPAFNLTYEAWSVIIRCNGDVYLLRLSTFFHGVDFAIISVAEQVGAGCSEESYRIAFVVGNLLVA